MRCKICGSKLALKDFEGEDIGKCSSCTYFEKDTKFKKLIKTMMKDDKKGDMKLLSEVSKRIDKEQPVLSTAIFKKLFEIDMEDFIKYYFRFVLLSKMNENKIIFGLSLFDKKKDNKLVIIEGLYNVFYDLDNAYLLMPNFIKNYESLIGMSKNTSKIVVLLEAMVRELKDMRINPKDYNMSYLFTEKHINEVLYIINEEEHNG